MHLRLTCRNICCGALVLMLMIGAGSCAPFQVAHSFRGGADNSRVRILLVATKSEFTISSKSAMRVAGDKRDSGRHTIIFRPQDIRGTVTVEPVDSPVELNGSPYRGYIEIIPSNNIIHIVNIVRVDEYLASVVPGEIPAEWDREALKAQAVAARTYTYYHIIHNASRRTMYDLDATTSSQVYRGISDEKKSTTKAVFDTSGEILVYDTAPILSYFHSTCGGKTSDDKHVWNGNEMPYLKSVRCGFCGDSTKFKWESRLTLAEMKKYISAHNPGIGTIQGVMFRRSNDRVAEVRIRHDRGTLTLSGNNFRLMFPTEKIRSLYFKSKKLNDGLLLKGYGWGHGVGMCQWGARGMARHGYGYRDILKHYYTGVSLASVRNGYLASKNKEARTFQ